MNNLQIHIAFEKHRAELYDFLSIQSISGLFKKEYQSLKEGSIVYLGDTDQDVQEVLKQLSEDTSHDQLFYKKVQYVNQLDNNNIISSFQNDIIYLLNLIAERKIENGLQAVFIEYDYYYHFKGQATGYGKQNYPIVIEPNYLSEVDFSKVLFYQTEVINFEKAWIDCEDFNWTGEHLDVYYQLQRLFQLNSRLLLHQAIQKCYEKGHFDFLKVRPLTFYINEHDSEVMTLFRID